MCLTSFRQGTTTLTAGVSANRGFDSIVGGESVSLSEKTIRLDETAQINFLAAWQLPHSLLAYRKLLPAATY